MVACIASLLHSKAAGAAVAQVCQAADSFALQIVAAWTMGVTFQPFASLAAVRGRQRRVFTCPLIDAAFAVAALTALLASGVSAAWTPYVLAAGLVLGGFLDRLFVLAPLSKPIVESTTEQLRMSHA